VLQVVRGVVDAPLLEPCFRPSPQAFNRIKGARVAPVENHLDAALFGLCPDTFCAVDAKVINQHDALAPTSVLGYLLKEVAVGKLVDCLVNYMDSDNHTIYVNRSCDSYGLKSKFFSFNQNGFMLWCKPNFWRNLISTKDCLVHKQELLLFVNRLEEPWESKQTSLPLPAQLPVSELEVNTKDTLLDALFVVKTSKPVHRDRVAGPTTIKLLNTLP
jgi:hypothetical protein